MKTIEKIKENPLTKILELQKLKNQEKEEQILDDVKLLLETNESREREILGIVGLDEHIKVFEAKKSISIVRNKHKETYIDENIYSLKDIEELALKYRLYLRKSNEYRGNIPNDLGIDLKKFFDKYNLDSNQYMDGGNFRILAPPSMFKDYVKSHEKIGSFLNDMNTERKAWVDSFKDPLLFYKIDADNYLLLRSWGETFTPLRRLYGFLAQNNIVNIISFTVMLFMCFVLPIYVFIYGHSFIDSFTIDEKFSVKNLFLNITHIILFLTNLFVTIMSWIYLFKGVFNVGDKNNYTRKNWSIWQLKIKNMWNK